MGNWRKIGNRFVKRANIKNKNRHNLRKIAKDYRSLTACILDKTEKYSND